MNAQVTPALTRDDFEAALRAKGGYYHIHHPFHRAMYSGGCTPAQIRGWVANRYYYQINIPQKDAAIMANCPDASVRRLWLQRILDHDGHDDDAGGIEAWLLLAEAVGLTREEVIDQRHVLPGVISLVWTAGQIIIPGLRRRVIGISANASLKRAGMWSMV
jgi:pyrroloquinoline-quinone synthase